jgi:hypothetical protein
VKGEKEKKPTANHSTNTVNLSKLTNTNSSIREIPKQLKDPR